MKPTVYIETTIVGHLTSRLPSNVTVMGQMLDTRKWWNDSRQDFELVISELVQQEITQGDPTAAAERLAAIEGIRPVPILDPARLLANALVAKHGLPEKARVDALHLAICATNDVSYLLTWNCRHLANATRQKTIAEICTQAGYTAPVICTPTQLTELENG
jgi:predicted nucleic acid-binding protein